MNIELLQQLCEASAVSGDEQEVRDILIIKQVIISLACAFVVFTFVETFTNVDMFKADKHPGIGTLDGPVTGHLFE